MLTMTAPSRMVTCTVGLEIFSFTGVRSCRHSNKSDFVPVLRASICDSALLVDRADFHACRIHQDHHCISGR